MIVAEKKPFAEIKQMVKDRSKIMILGCGTCVAVCMAGGERGRASGRPDAAVQQTRKQKR